MKQRMRMLEGLDRDIRDHIARETQDNIERGMREDEARYAALRKFGNATRVKEETRKVWSFMWIEQLLQEVRFSLRILRKSRGFTAVAVLTIALGIGANTAIFSVVRAVIFRPLPFPRADRLAVALVLNPDIPFRTSAGLRDFVNWQTHSRSFESLAGMTRYGGGVLTGEGDPESVFTNTVTWEFFKVLGIPPERGRVFTADDERPGAPRVAILSREFWQRHYGGEDNILNRQVTLNNQKYTIVGIMPSGFSMPNEAVDFWTPLSADRTKIAGQAYFTLVCIGRLKPGISTREAQADLETVSPFYGPKRKSKYYLKVSSLREDAAGESRAPLLVLFGAVCAVLLIACANISNLLSMRMVSRRREFAVREALGAGRARLTRQMLVESITLSTIGGAAGLLLASWGVPVLAASVPESLGLPNAAGIRIDGTVLLFSLAAILLTGILFGIAPAIQLDRGILRDSLKEGAHGSTGNARGGKLRSRLVVAEVAMSLVLLAGAGLLLRTLYEMERINLGFNPHHVLTVPVDSASAGDGPGSLARAVDRVRGLPSVRNAGSVQSVPLTGIAASGPVWAFGQPAPTNSSEMVMAKVWRISAGYLDTMGIPLLTGRDFNEGDRPDVPTVAIVNESLVRQFFPRGEYVGKRIVLAGFSNPPYDLEIVGVTADTKSYQLTADSGPQVFLDNAQGPLGFGVLVIRTEGDPAGIAGAVRSEIRSASPNLIPGNPRAMEFYLASALAKPRFSAILLSCFATIAMLLAAVGIVGVISNMVSNRTHEIGIRMALGAESGTILRMVILEGMMPAVAGIAIGLAGGLSGANLIRSFLFGVRPLDPLTFAVAGLILSLVAIVACYLPARRATRVDPIIALRCD